MRRGFSVWIALVLLTGCTGGAPSSGPEPVPVPVPPTAGKKPAPAEVPPALAAVSHESSLAALTGEPVGWVRQEPLVVVPGVCQPEPGAKAPLAVQVRQVEWKQHPLAIEPFYVPAVTLAVCNPTEHPLESLFLRLDRTIGDIWDSMGSMGPLDLLPGDGIGPIRFYPSQGLPARMLPEGGSFPDWRYRLSINNGTLGEFGGAGEASGPEVSLGLLRSQAWDSADLPAHEGELFLYAPDAQYSVQVDPYCGATEGQVSARANRWALYASKGGGEPVHLVDLGEYSFEGGRGLRVEPVPSMRTTFIGLEQYGSCAVPTFHMLYAYDHAKGEVYRVQARDEKGQTRRMSVASFTVTPDGALENRYYDNAGEHFGWNTVIYHWVAEERTWVEESHTISQ